MRRCRPARPPTTSPRRRPRWSRLSSRCRSVSSPYTESDRTSAQAEVRRAQAQLALAELGARAETDRGRRCWTSSARKQRSSRRGRAGRHRATRAVRGSPGFAHHKPWRAGRPGGRRWDSSPTSARGRSRRLTSQSCRSRRLPRTPPRRSGSTRCPGVDIPAKVVAIKPIGETKRGDITYTVVLKPDQPNDQLRWNMTAAVTITPRSSSRRSTIEPALAQGHLGPDRQQDADGDGGALHRRRCVCRGNHHDLICPDSAGHGPPIPGCDPLQRIRGGRSIW